MLLCSVCLFAISSKKSKNRPHGERRTEAFQKIVAAILHHYAKARDFKVPFQNWTDAPTSLKELMIGLGKAAFQGLQKKQLYFTDAELFKAGMSLEALELGLLVKLDSTSFWKRDEYTFSHLTLQECFAAPDVSGEVLQTDADLTKLLEKMHLYDGHLTMFWIFLAGLLEGGLVEVLFAQAASAISEGTLSKHQAKPAASALSLLR